MTRPLRVGLTGSIGMGKTATARLFAEAGVPVWDADAAVHRMYAPGGAAVSAVAALCPSALTPDGGIDRAALKAWIAGTPGALARLEAVVHPLVAADRERFIATASAPAVALDIPLLFETGADAEMDLVVVVSTDAETQKARVLARPGMTEDQFARILGKQMPDAEKRARADMIVLTDTPESARADVADVLQRVGLLMEERNA